MTEADDCGQDLCASFHPLCHRDAAAAPAAVAVVTVSQPCFYMSQPRCHKGHAHPPRHTSNPQTQTSECNAYSVCAYLHASMKRVNMAL